MLLGRLCSELAKRIDLLRAEYVRSFLALGNLFGECGIENQSRKEIYCENIVFISVNGGKVVYLTVF